MAYSKQNFQNGQILNAANLEAMENGIIAGQGAHNLLDNSNFKDPVNSRGKTTYNSGEYTIDRWKNQIGTNMTLMDGFIRITGDWDTRQYLREKLIGTYTFAVYAKVNVAGGYTQMIEVFENDSSIASSTCTGVGEWKIYTCTATFTGANNITSQMVIINNRAGNISDASMDVQWAALYEGSYDASTLPSYVPKGKYVEMLNCGVPLAPHNLLDNSDFTNPVNQRGQTSYPGEASKLTYTIDRWNIWDTHAKTEVTASGLKITGIDVMGYIAQLFEKPDKMIGKTYTLAAGMSDGTIICGTATVPSTTQTEEYYISAIASSDTTPGLRLQVAGNLSKVRFQFSVKPGKTYIIVWAALYEGSYDASTLPAYQPKGYTAELAECQRYYENSWFGVKKTDTQEYFAHIWSAQQADARIEFKQQKRVSPTVTFYPIGTESNWKIFNGGYQIVDRVENIKRGGLSGFIARVTKGSSDGTTWTAGYTIQAQGHWEASADL